MNALPPICPREHHNYAAFFLTFACNLRCSYCINLHDGEKRDVQARRPLMDTDDWIAAANRLILRADMPLTLQGGEPTLHPGFYRIVNEVKPEIKMDLMTNMMFDPAVFIQNVPVDRFTREAPYAAIRVSYHPGQNNINDLIKKTMYLQDAGFRIGLYGILHPDPVMGDHIKDVCDTCLNMGIDFRTKEFLGEYQGKMYGTFKYEGSVAGKTIKQCECRTTEILVDPSGAMYRCHSDLYSGRKPVSHILDPNFSADQLDAFRQCNFFGNCNPCDVKLKTNRLQIFGHTSVEVKNIEDKSAESDMPDSHIACNFL